MNTPGPRQNVRREIVDMLPRLRRFARNLTRHPQDADDVVQIAVARALERLDQWRSDQRLDGWLFKIVRNAWIDELRARGRRDRLFVAEEAGEHVGLASMEAVADLLSVRAALGRLPEEQRMAVALVLVEGLPYKDAAEVLDIPIGTLTSRLARAREALRTMLEPDRGT